MLAAAGQHDRSILRDAAARAPDKIALIEGNPSPGEHRPGTYRALLSDAEGAARALLRRFAPGERIAVWTGNSPEWLILEFAAALARLPLVTVYPAYRGEELAHVLGHSEADGLFMADEYQSTDLHAILAKVRGRLPGLREVDSVSDPAGDGLAAELAEFCRARLAAYQVPIRWLITDALPLTASGKIRKDVLRKQLAGRSPA